MSNKLMQNINDKDFNISEYFGKLNKIYAIKDKNQTLTETLNEFNQITKSYSDFVQNNSDELTYSDYNFLKCSREEQEQFFNDQLQLLECLVTNSIYDKQGLIWNWYDIYKLLYDASYKNTDKIQRKVVYSTSTNSRPIGNSSYLIWNGMQIIDLDIKDEMIASNLKQNIFDELKRYHWFLGVCKSASGKGLHIWTKITPLSFEATNRKVEYLCNFRHKYSYVYIVLTKYASQYGYTKDKIFEYMDMAMAKPQQGIFISSDNTALLNTNFKDLRLDVNFESAFVSGVESINWISHPDLKDIFHKLEWFNTERETDDVDVSNISGINDRDAKNSKGKLHYKHAQRWQLANTLTSIYGYDKALSLMVEICKGTSYNELAGDVKTASIHNKPISTWAIKELNRQHGFNLKIKAEDLYKKEIEKIEEDIKTSPDTDPIKILNSNTEHVELHLKSNQYLSDIKSDIIKNLSHITLLEAGAGYGKTEMIKSLKAKTMLILPFTSTIKAKVEADSKTSDWLYYYGSKRPTLDDILGDKNMSMTIDKFSNLNIMELDQANFEYIVIDESHLLFTSSYRDVMSPTIQRLANCKAKVIMMTGTPTGEILFFPSIKHIKVIKEDFRQKEFNVVMVPTKNEKMTKMCKMMAKDIIDGKKILYPTNKGNLFYSQVTGLIQEYLNIYKYPNKLKSFYYKKSNYGDESMDDINFSKTVGNNDIVFCSNYLSVGVDICDRNTFSVYFSEPWIAQDIEQFANRLRNNDLYVTLILEKEDSTGFPIDYYHTMPLDLSISQKDLLLSRDLIRTCNDMLERNNEESKYNPLIQSLLASNRYLKYDENDCKYYIDETTYKLRVFEERYSDYSKQLSVMIDGMKYYGYHTTKSDDNERIPEDKLEWLGDYMKSCRHIRYDWWTNQTFILLDHLNDGNIDVYKELLKGDYALFKDDKYKEERDEHNLYVESIEILERNIPIILGLYKFYACDTIKEIYEYCIDKKQNKINYAKLDRIRRFVNIESNRRQKRLDFPVYKYIKDAQQFAKDNPVISQEDLTKWLANYAAKYANSIKNIVVDDIDFLEEIYDLVCQIFNVVVIKGRPSKGMIKISPFELLWEQKNDLTNLYGNLNTKEFFSDLVDNMVVDETEEELPELEHTSKLQLKDIIYELPNVVHKQYDYFEYSSLDKSNERFMRKQENTNTLRDNIFAQIDNNDIPKDESKNLQGNLFEKTTF